jgi:predicted flap endonuclease-1-like 5' DNA nuclease
MLHRNKTVVGVRAMTSFLPEIPKIDPEKGPNLLAGATSPLWLVFGGAAMAGATWWWWTARWREAVNVEALMAPALALKPQPASPPVIDPVTEAPVLAFTPAEVVEPAPVETPAPVAAAVETVEAVATEAVETAKAVAEPLVEAAADDLTLLIGIGPKLSASLAELGVTRFAQIAAWGPEDLADFDAKLNLRGRAERDAWVAQAKRLTAG